MKKTNQQKRKGSSSMRKQYPTHIFKEESKEIWALCTSSLSAMAISARMKKSFIQQAISVPTTESSKATDITKFFPTTKK